MSVRCDVLAIGTELLLGQIVDTNSAWIGEQLAANGIDCLFQAKVGDNHARIVDGLRASLARADAVLVCGGLGPTHDDITREAITEVMGSELVVDEAVADVIRHLFESRGRRMPDNNLRQAMVPVGATVIPQTRSATRSSTPCPASPTRCRRCSSGRCCPTSGAARATRRSSRRGCCGRGARARAGSTSACAT